MQRCILDYFSKIDYNCNKFILYKLYEINKYHGQIVIFKRQKPR